MLGKLRGSVVQPKSSQKNEICTIETEAKSRFLGGYDCPDGFTFATDDGDPYCYKHVKCSKSMTIFRNRDE